MRLHSLRFAILGVSVLSVSVRLASGQTSGSVQIGPQQIGQAALPASAKDQQPVLSIAEGRLTLKVKNVRLRWILDRLTEKAKVAIQVGAGAGSELVTLDLQDAPLDEALRQLLSRHDTFFFYGVNKEGPAVLQVVWVYPKEKGRGLQPVPPEDWASTKDLEAASADNDSETRLKAVVGVIERSSRDRATEVALRALSDPDENVRSMALFAASTRGLEILPDTMMNLFTSDPSASVRFLALEALAKDPNSARTFAELGLKDPDSKVKHRAREILTGLDAAERRRRGETTPRRQNPRSDR